VLAAAVELVDAQGLESLSMRRLGERLGVEAMSLYRYVQGKQDLLNGVHGAILEEVERPPAAGTWTKRLRSMAVSFRSVLGRHPNALPLFASRPAVTAGSLRAVEECLDLLAEAGFGPAERLHAFHGLAGFVVGISLFHFGFEEAAYVDFALDPAAFPRTRESLEALSWDFEHEFAFGLDALLAGLEARLGKRKAKKARQ
jgi:AcrR family transcriptional regulator